MNKELIEKLKDKTYVRAFGLMSSEEQECYKKVGIENCLLYTNGDNWNELLGGYGHFHNGTTYAIKPGYQPEPQFVDLEIMEHTEENDDRWLVVWRDRESMFLPYPCTQLRYLSSQPNFHCFWFDEGAGFLLGNAFHTVAYVSPQRYEGKKVYARFRK